MTSPSAFELAGLSKVYGGLRGGPETLALRDVNLTIPSGLLVTIAGPSGSGKSTLLGLLGLLDQPTSGTIRVAGESATEAHEPARCQLRAMNIGFVFQAFHLMQGRSALENVMLGGLYRGMRRTERADEAIHRLEQVGLGGKARSYARTLSGGERQRVAIARALLGSPKILLCDEPTGNLDSSNGGAVVEILKDLPTSGVCVVVVTHDNDIARLGDQQIRVVDGVVTGDGCA